MKRLCLYLCLLSMAVLFVWLAGACGRAEPTATSRPFVAATATQPLLAMPTETSTPVEVVPGVPLTVEIKSTVIAGLPPTPTPEAGGGSTWGDVRVLPLEVPEGGMPLWAAFSVGMDFYAPEAGHFVALFTQGDGGLQELGRVVLTTCAQYVGDESLSQVQVAPERIWLELQSYAGAHGGCYDLLSFDGRTLRHEVLSFNSSPGAGNTADLDGDGRLEVILNQTENYVFCYACGVRLPLATVLRWDGQQLLPVELETLPETAPAQVRSLNDQAVTLARGNWWRDAAQVMAGATAQPLPDPAQAETVAWNAILIDLQAESLAEEAGQEIYPLLANVFYGDYEAALEVMRPYSAADLWGPGSPLVVDTPAEGWEMALSDWISWTTGPALEVAADLAAGADPADRPTVSNVAAAHFVRAWGRHLAEPESAEVLAGVEAAAALAPDEPLYAASLVILRPEAAAVPTAAPTKAPPAAPTKAPTAAPAQPPAREPLAPSACYDLGLAMVQSLRMTVTVETAPFEAPFAGGSGTGCLLTARGTGADFGGVGQAADTLAAMLARRGWERDLAYAADGPTGTFRGFQQGAQLCLLSVEWEPAPEANCPADRPISECKLAPEQQLYTVALNCAGEAAAALPGERWQVRNLLAGPGSPGRLYALLTPESSGAWPTDSAYLLVSDDYGRDWSPFAGGLPAGGCLRSLNMDYAAPDALYASTCTGLYRWSGFEWRLVTPRETGMVAIVYGRPDTMWATEIFASGGAVSRSDDGGTTWRPASDGLIHFNGVANLGIDPRDANTLYAVIWPKYAGSYLRRGSAAGQWQTMPTPLSNNQIDTGITIDGTSGALYVTVFAGNWQLWRTFNPSTADMNNIRWELVHDFGPDVSWASLLASGWSPQGLALYANLSSWVNKASGEVGPPAPYRSLDGGQTWKPLPIP